MKGHILDTIRPTICNCLYGENKALPVNLRYSKEQPIDWAELKKNWQKTYHIFFLMDFYFQEKFIWKSSILKRRLQNHHIVSVGHVVSEVSNGREQERYSGLEHIVEGLSGQLSEAKDHTDDLHAGQYAVHLWKKGAKTKKKLLI